MDEDKKTFVLTMMSLTAFAVVSGAHPRMGEKLFGFAAEFAKHMGWDDLVSMYSDMVIEAREYRDPGEEHVDPSTN